MKILLLSQYFWPETFLINSLTARLVSVGHTVEVLTGQPNYPQGRIYPGYHAWQCKTESYKGAMLHRIPLFPRASGGLRLALNYLSFILSSMVFGPWALRKRDVDVVLVYAPSPLLQALPAIFLGWLKRKRVVLWVQDLWPESLSATGYVRNPAILKGIEHIVRFIYRHIDLILVQSEAFVEPVRKLAPRTRIAYLPNSIDDSFALRVEADSVADNKFTVLFAGNMGTAQAVDCIIGAAEILRTYPDIRFELVEMAASGLGCGTKSRERDWSMYISLGDAQSKRCPNSCNNPRRCWSPCVQKRFLNTPCQVKFRPIWHVGGRLSQPSMVRALALSANPELAWPYPQRMHMPSHRPFWICAPFQQHGGKPWAWLAMLST